MRYKTDSADKQGKMQQVGAHGPSDPSPGASMATTGTVKLTSAVASAGGFVRSLALANQKGGVGKTTTAIHLAHGLALRGERVALFDLDPHGNATIGLEGMSAEGEDEGLGLNYLRCVHPGMWLLSSPGAVHGVDRHSGVDVAKLQVLSAELEERGFQWLIVDCPPRIDQWGWAGIQLCREVVVPVQAEFFAMHGLSHMMTTLQQARASFRDVGNLLGLLPTMVDWREQVCRDVVDDLRIHLGSQVFDSVILRDSQVVEAASHGQTVFRFNPVAKAALCFGELIREVVDGRS